MIDPEQLSKFEDDCDNYSLAHMEELIHYRGPDLDKEIKKLHMWVARLVCG